MSGNDDEFRLLMEQVLAGDANAASVLQQRYGPAIHQAVRTKLNRQLRSKFDSLDFVQDVWLSFFANPPAEDRFLRAENLVAYLAQVARNKVVDVFRQQRTKKWDVRREHFSLNDSTDGSLTLLPAPQPTPSETVSRGEEWQRLLESQPPVYRRVLILLREGKKPPEIAAELDLHVRTVRRVIAKVLTRPTP